jgi:hypothetical protein
LSGSLINTQNDQVVYWSLLYSNSIVTAISPLNHKLYFKPLLVAISLNGKISQDVHCNVQSIIISLLAESSNLNIQWGKMKASEVKCNDRGYWLQWVTDNHAVNMKPRTMAGISSSSTRIAGIAFHYINSLTLPADDWVILFIQNKNKHIVMFTVYVFDIVLEFLVVFH